MKARFLLVTAALFGGCLTGCDRPAQQSALASEATQPLALTPDFTALLVATDTLDVVFRGEPVIKRAGASNPAAPVTCDANTMSGALQFRKEPDQWALVYNTHWGHSVYDLALKAVGANSLTFATQSMSGDPSELTITRQSNDIIAVRWDGTDMGPFRRCVSAPTTPAR